MTPPAVGGGCPGLGDHGAVLAGNLALKRRGQIALLPERRGLADPDRRVTADFAHLVGEPLELLPVAAVEGKRDEPVPELGYPQPLQLPPSCQPRCRRLAREPIREQDPAPDLDHGATVSIL